MSYCAVNGLRVLDKFPQRTLQSNTYIQRSANAQDILTFHREDDVSQHNTSLQTKKEIIKTNKTMEEKRKKGSRKTLQRLPADKLSSSEAAWLLLVNIYGVVMGPVPGSGYCLNNLYLSTGRETETLYHYSSHAGPCHNTTH